MRSSSALSCLLTLVSCCVAGTALSADIIPVKAEIVEVPAERRDWGEPIGNVRVTFSDGRKEMWTREGRALLPKVAASGYVGWSRYTQRNSRGEPVNSILRVLLSEKDIKDFNAPEGRPFIEEWDFTDKDTAVVIKSRGRHGPANFVKYDLKSGKRLASVEGYKPYDQLPDWAKPFSDDKP